MSTFSIYIYSVDDGEAIFYVSNHILPTLDVSRQQFRGTFIEKSIGEQIVDCVISESGLEDTGCIFLYKVTDTNSEEYKELCSYLEDE